MIENLDIYLSTIVDLIKNGEFKKAKEEIDLVINDMIVLDFKNRQDCIRRINVQIERMKKMKTSIRSEMECLPDGLRLHALEAMRDTLESFEKKILEYQRERTMLSKPRYKT